MNAASAEYLCTVSPPPPHALERHDSSRMSLADAWIMLALAAVSIFYLAPFSNTLVFLDRDEGIVLQGATRILGGELPYRDFFSFYTPGSYYWNAFLLKTFGDSILVPRAVMVLYGAFFSVLTYGLARRMSPRKDAASVSLLLLVCCLPARFVTIHSWDSTVAALLALVCALSLLRSPGPWLAALTGLFTGLTILFNQARGMGLLLGLVLGFSALKLRKSAAKLNTRHFAWMSALALLPLMLSAAFFGLHGAFRPMVDGLIWPLLHYSRANHLPYGYMTMRIADWSALFGDSPLAERALNIFIISPVFILCALPIVVVVVALWCALASRPDLPPGQIDSVILSGAVLLGSLLSVIVARPDFLHITFLAPLFFFLLPWLFRSWTAPFPALRKVGPLVMVYGLMAVSAYGLALIWPVRNSAISLETARGTVRLMEFNETIPFMQANFPPGSKLLVHPYLPLYSFLTRTRSPLRYDFFQPGMHTPEQFQEAADQLAALKPPAVLFEPGFGSRIPNSWPNTPVSAMIRDPVADYIVRNYRVCRILDGSAQAPFLFMVRKDLNCAPRIATSTAPQFRISRKAIH